MVGIPARSTLVEVKPATQAFTPYGTPCSERFDSSTQKLEILQCEMETMQKRLTQLFEERAAADTAAEEKSAPRKKATRKSA